MVVFQLKSNLILKTKAVSRPCVYVCMCVCTYLPSVKNQFIVIRIHILIGSVKLFRELFSLIFSGIISNIVGPKYVISTFCSMVRTIYLMSYEISTISQIALSIKMSL